MSNNITQAQKEQDTFNNDKLIIIGVNKFPEEKINSKPKQIKYNPKCNKANKLAESLE